MLHQITRGLLSLQDTSMGRTVKRAMRRATQGTSTKRIRRWTVDTLQKGIKRPIRQRLSLVDGHRVDLDRIGRDSIVYSCGIGQTIDFEFDLNRHFGCQVELFDPAPRSIAYIATQPAIPGLNFSPMGVWNADRTTRFYFDGDRTSSADAQHTSACNLHAQSEFFEAEARTLRSLMHDRGHHHIDLLKLDVEGGAALILDQAFEDGVCPSQITAHLDQPAHRNAIGPFFEQTLRLCEQLEDSGYDISVQPCASETDGRIELTAIRVEAQPVHRGVVADSEPIAAEPVELALACD